MDLFGRKRIAQQQAEIIRLQRREAELAPLGNQIEYLVRTIRDMDQHIYNMGQRDNWPAQRPHFQELHDGMTARKVAESNRIGDILRGEMIDTYAPNIAQKRLNK